VWWVGVSLLLLAAPAFSEVKLPPRAGVTDAAGLLSGDELRELARWKASLEQQRNVHLMVLTLPDAGDESPEVLATRVMADWKVGSRSVLLLVLAGPRRVHVQPSADLAQALSPAKAREISETVVAPALFGKGGAAGALSAGLEKVATQAVSRDGLRGLGIRGWGSLLFSAFVAAMWLVLLKRLFVAGGKWLERLRYRKDCECCGGAMAWRNEVAILPTRNASGRGLRLYLCRACGTSRAVPYVIPAEGNGGFRPRRPGYPVP
jgi:uncharacterized membrane protein YgcG